MARVKTRATTKRAWIFAGGEKSAGGASERIFLAGEKSACFDPGHPNRLTINRARTELMSRQDGICSRSL